MKEKICKFLKNNLYLFVAVAIGLCLRHYRVLGVNKVVGTSMMPTLEDGQLTFASSIGDFGRGDIVDIQLDDETLLVKRIIGLPGETIEHKDGHMYIDGTLYEEDYLAPENNVYSSQEEWTITLGDDEYFCMGDNRDDSRDSRYYGPFSRKQLIQEVYIY